jgi:hypothetical protein
VLPNSKILRLAFSGVAIILLIITVILSISQGTQVGGKNPIIFDKKIIPALQNISKIVPKDERIITPSFTPIVMYFTVRDVSTPYAVPSYVSLLNFMNNKSFSYLLVFENRSEIPALKQVFNKEYLPNLSKNFQEIANYTTEFDKLHLYKREK